MAKIDNRNLHANNQLIPAILGGNISMRGKRDSKILKSPKSKIP